MIVLNNIIYLQITLSKYKQPMLIDIRPHDLVQVSLSYISLPPLLRNQLVIQVVHLTRHQLQRVDVVWTKFITVNFEYIVFFDDCMRLSVAMVVPCDVIAAHLLNWTCYRWMSICNNSVTLIFFWSFWWWPSVCFLRLDLTQFEKWPFARV